MKHGTTTGYCYYKCRCQECKEAQRDYMNKYRKTEHGKTRQKLSNDISDIRKQLAAEILKNKYPHLWTVVCNEAEQHATALKLKKMEDRRKFNGRPKAATND